MHAFDLHASSQALMSVLLALHQSQYSCGISADAKSKAEKEDTIWKGILALACKPAA